MEFAGQLSLAEDESLEATLRVEDEFLAIDLGAGRMGRWPLAKCRLARNGQRFSMMIGEEAASFAAADPEALGDWVEDRWPPTPAAKSILERLSLAQVAGVGVLIVLAAIVVTGLLARDRPSPDLLSTAPTETTVPSLPIVFQSGVDQVTLAWNGAADRLRVNLFLVEAPGPNRLQMNLADGLILYATEDPATGRVRTLMLAAGPTTGEAEGEAVLAAWGTLIATVNPELDGEGRRNVLANLGVQPKRPLPNGIDSQAVAGGATYTLRSGVLGGRAILIVSLTS